MKLEEDKTYVTRTLQVVHKIQKNGYYHIGKLLEQKNWKLEFHQNGECNTYPYRQSIVEKVTAKQSNHGIYSDFEISLNRLKTKPGTCTIFNHVATKLFPIRYKRESLDNCLK